MYTYKLFMLDVNLINPV